MRIPLHHRARNITANLVGMRNRSLPLLSITASLRMAKAAALWPTFAAFLSTLAPRLGQLTQRSTKVAQNIHRTVDRGENWS